MAVEWSDDLENIFADGLGTGVENDVRAFRAAIVARWAAEYARKRGSGADPEVAMSDLRRWAHAYFQPNDAGADDDETEDCALEAVAAGGVARAL
jgi:hypothetical protein